MTLKNTFSKISFSMILSFCGLLFFQNQFTLGQEKNRKISLKEAIQLAMQTRPDLKNQNLKQQITENEVNKAKSAFLPTLDLGIDGRLNTQLQTNVIPGAAFGGNGADRKVQFGTPVNLQAFLQADQKILDPALKTNLHIAQTKVKTEVLNTQKALIDIQIAIATAYFQLALSQEKKKQAASNVLLFSELETQAKTKLEQASALPTDVEKAALDLKNAKFQFKREENNCIQVQNALAKELGLAKENAAFETESLIELEQQITRKNTDINNQANSRLEYQIEQNAAQINALQQKKYEKDWQPRLNAYGFLAVQSFRSDLNITKEVYPFNYVGLKMTMPIFDAFKRKDNKKEIGLMLQQNQNNLLQLENNISFEKKQAALQMNTALEALEVAKENQKLAENLFQKTKARFESASVLKSEVTAASQSVLEARNNYLSALYDVFVAHLSSMKAEGKVVLD